MKVCFKCNENKELNEYYKHSAMKDGHLNKCKECAKKDSNINFKEKSKCFSFVLKERDRTREKYHRLDYKGKYKPTYENKKKATKKYHEKFPEKKAVRNLLKHVETEDGFHNHHWSYDIKHAKSVIKLSITDHNLIHRFLIYDQEHKMYRRSDIGLLLDTKEKHYNYINTIIKF